MVPTGLDDVFKKAAATGEAHGARGQPRAAIPTLEIDQIDAVVTLPRSISLSGTIVLDGGRPTGSPRDHARTRHASSSCPDCSHGAANVESSAEPDPSILQNHGGSATSDIDVRVSGSPRFLRSSSSVI